MSDAALPNDPGEKYAHLAKSGNYLQYSGIMEDSPVDFFFNIENNSFLCETTIDGNVAKMAGDLLKDNDNYKCIPKYGIQPNDKSGEWVDKAGEEEKTFDLTSSTLNFEGCTLTKQN